MIQPSIVTNSNSNNNNTNNNTINIDDYEDVFVKAARVDNDETLITELIEVVRSVSEFDLKYKDQSTTALIDACHILINLIKSLNSESNEQSLTVIDTCSRDGLRTATQLRQWRLVLESRINENYDDDSNNHHHHGDGELQAIRALERRLVLDLRTARDRLQLIY